ncbi:MAG: hypothetical protein BroJett029_34370 [Alphaproteobacteria bacterium]|nr:MAG: hypothetical protein BroJett029_34370 [Alphaproteobacteria bacterium]
MTEALRPDAAAGGTPRPAVGSPAIEGIENGRDVSDVLREIANTWPEERISLGDFVDLFGDRGHGLLMFTLTLPNLVPIYLPGLSAITGLPLASLAVQLAIGMKHPWFPGFLRRRTVAVADLRRIVDRAERWLRPVERVLHARAPGLAHGPAIRIMGAVSALLALLLATPIPFTNMAFAAPIAVFSLGMVQRDGIAVAVSAVGSLAAVAVVFTASWTLIASALSVLGL